MDQVAGVLAPGRGLDHLAPDPSGGGVGGHVEVKQAAAVVADQEEDIESLEGQGLNHEEVSCPDGLAWLARKVRQLWLGGRTGPRRRWRRMERGLTAMPSLSS
jgi:hypothetical protein